MLESLHIRNLALVTELELDFGAGLNTVTGETGAGKSLIIGAVRLLAGARASAGIIRKGAQNCELTGTFRLDESDTDFTVWLNAFIEENALEPPEDDSLIIRRVITENGSRAFINGSQVPAAILRELGDRLVDIHGPNDTQSLLHTSRQMELLDRYATLGNELLETSTCWKKLQASKRDYESLCQETLAPEEIELLKFQLQEIEDAELQPDEEEELVARHKLLSHSQKLIEVSRKASQALDDGEHSATDALSDVLRDLREIERIDEKQGTEFCQRLEEISESLSDLSRDIEDYADNLDVDEEELNRVEERLDLLQKLKRKYGPSLEDVLNTAERLRNRLGRFSSRHDEMARLQSEIIVLEEAHRSACATLSSKRKASAEPLAEAITSRLKALGFNQAIFTIQIKPATAPGPRGADDVEFLFAPNPGEDISPLKETASSGEIARVMLAIKAVLSDVDNTPTMIFDEIDANVGGLVASAVAHQLHEIGLHHQVFCITHLPVIAAAGQRHYLVSKTVQDERTTTRMHRLEGQERTAEITRMMGAETSSDTAVRHAQELLQQFK